MMKGSLLKSTLLFNSPPGAGRTQSEDQHGMVQLCPRTRSSSGCRFDLAVFPQVLAERLPQRVLGKDREPKRIFTVLDLAEGLLHHGEIKLALQPQIFQHR
jgi:hypothetical protein